MAMQIGTNSKELLIKKNYVGFPLGSTVHQRLRPVKVPTIGGSPLVLLQEQASDIEFKTLIHKNISREISGDISNFLTKQQNIQVDVIPGDYEEVHTFLFKYKLKFSSGNTSPVEFHPAKIFSHINFLQRKSGGEGDLGKPYGSTIALAYLLYDSETLECMSGRLGIDEHWNQIVSISDTGNTGKEFEFIVPVMGTWFTGPEFNFKHMIRDEFRLEFKTLANAYTSTYDTAAADAALVKLTDFKIEILYHAHSKEDEGGFQGLGPYNGISTAFYDIIKTTEVISTATAGAKWEITMKGLAGPLAAVLIELVASGATQNSPHRGADETYMAWDRFYLADNSGANIQGGQETTWAMQRDFFWPNQGPSSSRFAKRYRYAMLLLYCENLALVLGAGKMSGVFVHDTNQRLFVTMASTGVSAKLSYTKKADVDLSTGASITGGTFRISWQDPISKTVETTGDLAYNATITQIKVALYGLKNWDYRGNVEFSNAAGGADLGASATTLFSAAVTYLGVSFGGSYANRSDITHNNFTFLSDMINGTSRVAITQNLTFGIDTFPETKSIRGVDGFQTQGIDCRMTGFTYAQVKHLYDRDKSKHRLIKW